MRAYPYGGGSLAEDDVGASKRSMSRGYFGDKSWRKGGKGVQLE